MTFENIDEYEQQKMKNQLKSDTSEKIQSKKQKSPGESIESFINGLSEGRTVKTHKGNWEVVYIKKNERGQTIIGRKKEGVMQSITAEALREEILESKRGVSQKFKPGKKLERGKTTQEEKTEDAENDFRSGEELGYNPERNRDLRAGGSDRDVGIRGDKIGKKLFELEEEIQPEEKKPSEEILEKKEEKLEEKSEEEINLDLLSRTREQIKDNELELSEETVKRWKDYLRERHYILLSKIAREFCEKSGLVQKGRENDPAFYIRQLEERGGLEALNSEDRKRLEKMERLQDILDMHGGEMTIDERYLLLHFGEERIIRIQDDIKEKEARGEDVFGEKAEFEKVRDMQADILSETLRDKDGKESFKKNIYERVYGELRREYENEGRLEEFEKMLAKQRGEKVKVKKEESEDKFIERREEKYHRILAEEISKIVGDREKAKGGIEKWYGEIKEGLVEELLEKKEKGELNLGLDKIPETEKEAEEAMPRAISKIIGRDVSEEEIIKAQKELERIRINWDGVKKIGMPFFFILAAFLYVIAGGLAVVGLGLKRAAEKIEKKTGKKT